MDDFVVGLIGPCKDAINIKNKIRIFLKDSLRLTLNEKKTWIINSSKTPIKFPGAFIKSTWEAEKRIQIIVRNARRYKGRATGNVKFHASIKELFEKATLNGFFKIKSNKFVPPRVCWFINFNHADIIRHFNLVIEGNLNYYSFANNRKSSGSFIYCLK